MQVFIPLDNRQYSSSAHKLRMALHCTAIFTHILESYQPQLEDSHAAASQLMYDFIGQCQEGG